MAVRHFEKAGIVTVCVQPEIECPVGSAIERFLQLPDPFGNPARVDKVIVLKTFGFQHCTIEMNDTRNYLHPVAACCDHPFDEDRIRLVEQDDLAPADVVSAISALTGDKVITDPHCRFH